METPTPITTDFGERGGGMSRSHNVRAENGNKYVAKGALYTPKFCHVGANEMVSLKLAIAMGLPVLDGRCLSLNGDVLFGCNEIDDQPHHPIVDDKIFALCENSDRVISMAIFDVWICNDDRHEGNLIARCGGQRDKRYGTTRCEYEEHFLVLVDHGSAFLPNNKTCTYFESLLLRKNIDEFVIIPYVRSQLSDKTKLSNALKMAMRISGNAIRSIIESIPHGLIAKKEKPSWIDYLKRRQNDLEEVFGTLL